MKFLLSFFVTLLISTSAMALTLEEAINLTLKSDDSIKQSRALVDSQKYAKRAAVAPFLPQAGVSYNYNDTTLTGDAPAQVPIGTTRDSSFSINLAYNIFNGLADVQGYRIGSNALLKQQYQYEGNKQDLILTTKTTYINYLNARKRLDVAKETMSLLEAQKKIAEVSFNVGTFSKADVLRVDVQLASTQLDLLNAQIVMRLARQQLERLIGRGIAPDEDVAEIAVEDNYPIPSIETLYQMLEDNRSEMKYVKAANKEAGLYKNRALSPFLPKINLIYNYGWNGDDTNAFGKRENNYDGSHVFGVVASWNLFQGFGDFNSYKATAMQYDASAYAVSDLRKKLRVQLTDSYENYFSARERLVVAKAGVEQAKEAYRVTNIQYENSDATTTDLLDASVALNQALISLASANYSIVAAVANIERAVETELLGLNIQDPDKAN